MIDFICSVESGTERKETVRVFNEPLLQFGGDLCCLEISEQIDPDRSIAHGVLLNKVEAREIAKRLLEYVNS